MINPTIDIAASSMAGFKNYLVTPAILTQSIPAQTITSATGYVTYSGTLPLNKGNAQYAVSRARVQYSALGTQWIQAEGFTFSGLITGGGGMYSLQTQLWYDSENLNVLTVVENQDVMDITIPDQTVTIAVRLFIPPF